MRFGSGRESAQQAHGTPDSDQYADPEKPIGSPGPEIPGLALRGFAAFVLDYREQVPDDHRSSERKGDLLDQQIEVKEFFHPREGTASWFLASLRAILRCDGRQKGVCW